MSSNKSQPVEEEEEYIDDEEVYDEDEEIVLDEDDEEVIILDEDGEGSASMTPLTASQFDFTDTIGGEMADEPIAKEIEYEILDSKQLELRQEEELNKIVDTLGVSVALARVLLRFYGWNVEKITNKFLDKGKEVLLKEAGLTEEQINEELNGDEEFSCISCCDDVTLKETTLLPGCKHRFCNNCWKTYITMKIKEGQAKRIFCMGFKCNQVVDESVVEKFVDKEIQEKYKEKVLASYVEDNTKLRWCPSTPFCGNAVVMYLPPTTPLEVRCRCKHEFCFLCIQQPHLPATCEMYKCWAQKCKDDSETFNWLKSNTKDCPKCGKAIEKNGGCNHMSCPCGHHFCWVCSGDFDYKTYNHSCGRYKENESTAEEARSSLRRYLHYFERYSVHEDSRKKSKELRASTSDKINKLYKLKPNSAWVEVQWMENAMETLFQARHVLQYSYVFAYYLFDQQLNQKAVEGCKKFTGKAQKIAQTLFEDNQEQLENSTEKLSGLLELPVDKLAFDEKVKKDVMGVTVLVDKRLHALLDVIQTDLMLEGFILPRPKSVISSGTKASSSFSAFQFSAPAKPAASASSSSASNNKKGGKKNEDFDDLELQMAIAESLQQN